MRQRCGSIFSSALVSAFSSWAKGEFCFAGPIFSLSASVWVARSSTISATASRIRIHPVFVEQTALRVRLREPQTFQQDFVVVGR